MSALGFDNGDEIEVQIFNPEEVIRQIKNYISPLTKQLEDLSRLIQGTSTAQQLYIYEICTFQRWF